MRCRRSLPAALAAVVALVPAAAHGAIWLEPVPLSDAATAAPQVDAGAGGDAVAIWAVDSSIQARLRAPGGAFGEIQTLATGGSAPDVEVAADGTAVAAWLAGDRVRVAIRPPGGAFGPTQDLAADGVGGTPSQLQLAANDAGETVLLYMRGGPVVAVRPAGGTFGAPVALSGGGCNPRAAVGQSGHAAVVWSNTCTPASAIRIARRSPGAGFGAAGDAGGESGANPAVAVEGDGSVAVAYERTGTIRVATAAPGGGFGAPVTVSDGAASEPSIAAAGGELWTIWRVGDRVGAARRPAGGAFGPAPFVSPAGIAAGAPRLHGSAAGGVLAAWNRQIGDAVQVEAAWRDPGAAAFGAAAVISSGSGALLGDVDGDDEGNATAGFLQSTRPVARVLDGAGPRFANLDLRPAGFALETYAFSFSPVDAWSAVTASAFDFGDGTTAAGPSASHAYPEPAGPRTLTISATDSAGNTSRLQRPFQVAPALDRTPPVISNLRLDAKRFRISTRPTPAYASARRRGTRLRYTLSEPAAVTITFERLLPGRRKGSRCYRGRRTGRRCKVSQPAGSIVRVHPVAGNVSVGFGGRITATIGPLRVYDNTLLPGSYRVTLAAIDEMRNRSRPVKSAFTIVTR